MKNRKLFIVVLAVITLLLLFNGCSSPEPTPPAEGKGEETDQQLFTLEEITQFDGIDGRAAYIVVDGIVYDVTNVPQWSAGAHYGFKAGADVTEALAKSAPHGANLLSAAKIVGAVGD